MNTYKGISVFSGLPIQITTDKGEIKGVASYGGKEKLPYVSPGLFDIQVNGYAGIDYGGSDLSVEMVGRIVRSLAAAGTTRHFPTIVTNSYQRIMQNLGIIASARRADRFVRDAIPGIHLEGPYISAEDGPRGAHDAAFVRTADYKEFYRWQDASDGMVKIVTLAPETENALPFIERITRDGVIAAIGHTNADPTQVREAVIAGARLSTHLGNGSHALIPRHENYIWAQLAEDELYASIICDGYHLPPPLMKVFTRVKGPDKIILISDAAFLAGSKPGVYRWGNSEIQLHTDGRITKARTPYFAGAGFLLNRGVAQFAKHSGGTLSEGIQACTINPAKLTRVNQSYFTFSPGSPAHIVFFHP